MLTTELDPYRPGYFDNPFAWTAGLRSTGQVLRDPRFGCSYVAGFDEARAVLHDKQRFSARGQFLLTRLDEAVRRGARAFDPASVTATAPPSLSYLDPPLLNRTRRLLLPVFGSRAAATFGPTQLYERTIGAVATDHEIDVVSVASSLSRAVLADFLGLPASSARVLADALGPGDGSSAADPTGRPSSRALRSYTSSLCRDPGTSGVLAELMALLAEAGIPESQAVSVASETALAVLVTSHQSLVRATVNLVRLLATRPDVWEDLRAGAATAAAVVEEGLRLEGATLALGRQATEPTVVGSDEVPAGTLLVVLLGSANRDCRRFPQGDELDPSRADNGHLAFAAG
ncbi:MAG TPA: cytochrome P450, partial [Acidimicrobiales bacterium]|nr:cytochrome P450 [Acidimicrobiales bacterium]